MRRIMIYSVGLALAGAAAAQSYYDDSYAPQATQGGYPPCSATITDRCIQLYEPGVATPANLALNERLGDGSTQLAEASYPEPDEVAYVDYDNSAVGGPYEPIDGAYEGVGGPYEEAYGEEYASAWPEESTGYYPPCSMSPADDRCIQTYEFGAY